MRPNQKSRKVRNEMTKSEMNKAVKAMTNAELNKLSDSIRTRREALMLEVVGDLKIGATVTFTGRGVKVKGIVEKVNRKTVKVRQKGTPSDCVWTVTPTLLTVVG